MYLTNTLTVAAILAYVVTSMPTSPQDDIFSMVSNATQQYANVTLARKSAGIRICSDATTNATCVYTYPRLWDMVTNV